MISHTQTAVSMHMAAKLGGSSVFFSPSKTSLQSHAQTNGIQRSNGNKRSKLVCKAMAKKTADKSEEKAEAGGQWYFNVTGFPFPLRPFVQRKTIVTEVSEEFGSICLIGQHKNTC